MGRTRTLPDAEVFATVRQLLAEGGDKAVGFSSVARATGLAAPTLVQRYGSRDGMVRAALLAGWDELDRAMEEADADAPMTAKGAVQLLKALSGPLRSPEFRDPALRERAALWRARVEAALARRLGGAEPAALLFAAWQGQLVWQKAGGKAFRLKDAVKRLG
jgi:AcrR family transcriptional regulator